MDTTFLFLIVIVIISQIINIGLIIATSGKSKTLSDKASSVWDIY